MKRKTLTIISIVSIIIISLILLGITYGYYLTTIDGNESSKSVEVATGDSKVLYTDLSTEDISEIIEPGFKTVKSFTVKNTGNVSATYSIYLVDVINNLNRTQDITYNLYKKAGTITDVTIESDLSETAGWTRVNEEVNVTFPTEMSVIAANEVIETPNQIYTYVLKVEYIDHPTENQNEDQGKIFAFKVNLRAEDSENNPFSEGTLAYNIIENATSEATVNYNKTSFINPSLQDGTNYTIPVSESSGENERILTYTTDNYGTSYYYRGAVQDNYVLFNNMCFRIVRIEGDGSVKLTLAGEVSEGATNCNGVTETSAVINNGASVTYGYKEITGLDGNTWYMADYENDGKTATNTTGNTSTSLKESLDTWFDTKFKSEGELTASGNKVKEDTWCLGGKDDYKYNSDGALLDATGLQAYYDENEYYFWNYSAYKRLFGTTKYADITCGDSEDKIKSRVGSITADEVALAGADGNWNPNETYYLFENAQYKYYWTLSRADFYDYGVHAFFVSSNGSLSGYYVDGNDPAVRPSVTLVTNTQIKKGVGTKGEPYIIEVE